jgi:hypothetical protein
MILANVLIVEQISATESKITHNLNLTWCHRLGTKNHVCICELSFVSVCPQRHSFSQEKQTSGSARQGSGNTRSNTGSFAELETKGSSRTLQRNDPHPLRGGPPGGPALCRVGWLMGELIGVGTPLPGFQPGPCGSAAMPSPFSSASPTFQCKASPIT